MRRCALPPSERNALLERADPELRATVVLLLAQERVSEKEDETGTLGGKAASSWIVPPGRVARAF